jgi:tRNA G37 N-methylase Trm5
MYYKNHKYEYPKKSKKRHGLRKQESNSSTRPYLSTLGNRRSYISCATSLDVLGDVVALSMDDTNRENRIQGALQMFNGTQRPFVSKKIRSEVCGKHENDRTTHTYFLGSEIEFTTTVDVLAGLVLGNRFLHL